MWVVCGLVCAAFVLLLEVCLRYCVFALLVVAYCGRIWIWLLVVFAWACCVLWASCDVLVWGLVAAFVGDVVWFVCFCGLFCCVWCVVLILLAWAVGCGGVVRYLLMVCVIMLRYLVGVYSDVEVFTD